MSHLGKETDPADQGKRGTRRSLLGEGHGIPLAVDGANRQDMKLIEATLKAIVVERGERAEESSQNIGMDKDYDYLQ